MIGDQATGPPAAPSMVGIDAAPAVARAAPAATRVKLRRPLWPSLLLSLLLLLVVAALAVARGPVQIPLDTVWRVLLAHTLGVHSGSWTAGSEAIIWQIRLPRVVLAGLVGGTLACSGATYQGVFRNPLADPYLIGVAAGAGLGAAVATVLPWHGYWHGVGLLPLFSFSGAIGAVALSYSVARSSAGLPLTTLILAGVAISTLASAAMSFLFMLHNDKFLTIFAWLLGGFNTAGWRSCGLILPYVLVTVVGTLGFGRVLNVLQFGEDQAQQLGVSVERVKLFLLVAASLGAAAAVSVSGLIGFVGLMVPHTVRLIWGQDYRRVLPLSLVIGAAFLILADLFARLVIAPQELPIGIVTAFCGVPFFLFQLRRRQRAVY